MPFGSPRRRNSGGSPGSKGPAKPANPYLNMDYVVKRVKSAGPDLAGKLAVLKELAPPSQYYGEGRVTFGDEAAAAKGKKGKGKRGGKGKGRPEQKSEAHCLYLQLQDFANWDAAPRMRYHYWLLEIKDKIRYRLRPGGWDVGIEMIKSKRNEISPIVCFCLKFLLGYNDIFDEMPHAERLPPEKWTKVHHYLFGDTRRLAKRILEYRGPNLENWKMVHKSLFAEDLDPSEDLHASADGSAAEGGGEDGGAGAGAGGLKLQRMKTLVKLGLRIGAFSGGQRSGAGAAAEAAGATETSAETGETGGSAAERPGSAGSAKSAGKNEDNSASLESKKEGEGGTIEDGGAEKSSSRDDDSGRPGTSSADGTGSRPNSQLHTTSSTDLSAFVPQYPSLEGFDPEHNLSRVSALAYSLDVLSADWRTSEKICVFRAAKPPPEEGDEGLEENENVEGGSTSNKSGAGTASSSNKRPDGTPSGSSKPGSASPAGKKASPKKSPAGAKKQGSAAAAAGGASSASDAEKASNKSGSVKSKSGAARSKTGSRGGRSGASGNGGSAEDGGAEGGYHTGSETSGAVNFLSDEGGATSGTDLDNQPGGRFRFGVPTEIKLYEAPPFPYLDELLPKYDSDGEPDYSTLGLKAPGATVPVQHDLNEDVVQLVAEFEDAERRKREAMKQQRASGGGWSQGGLSRSHTGLDRSHSSGFGGSSGGHESGVDGAAGTPAASGGVGSAAGSTAAAGAPGQDGEAAALTPEEEAAAAEAHMHLIDSIEAQGFDPYANVKNGCSITYLAAVERMRARDAEFDITAIGGEVGFSVKTLIMERCDHLLLHRAHLLTLLQSYLRDEQELHELTANIPPSANLRGGPLNSFDLDTQLQVLLDLIQKRDLPNYEPTWAEDLLSYKSEESLRTKNYEQRLLHEFCLCAVLYRKELDSGFGQEDRKKIVALAQNWLRVEKAKPKDADEKKKGASPKRATSKPKAGGRS